MLGRTHALFDCLSTSASASATAFLICSFCSGRDNLGMDLQRCVHRVPLSGCLKPFGGVQSQEICITLGFASMVFWIIAFCIYNIASLCGSHFGQPGRKKHRLLAALLPQWVRIVRQPAGKRRREIVAQRAGRQTG